VAIVLLAFAFAFPVQGLATVFSFLGRDTTAGSGIGLQAAGWLTLGVLLLMGRPGQRSDVVSLVLLAAATTLVVPAIGAALGKVLPVLVVAGTALRFVLTGPWERFGGTAWEHATGWEGVCLCGLALYVSLALELESVRKRSLLPLGRHRLGRRSVNGGLRDEVHHLEREPGVREQL